jgi:hypothetical protein
MKKFIFIGLFLFLSANFAIAQQKGVAPKSIISLGASLKKYHEKAELDKMLKGPLLDLYIERIKVLINTLPYIALTTRAGVTMADLGIPDTVETNKLLDTQKENTRAFLDATLDFQKGMTPYADKGSLVSSILYYEAMLKELNTLNE